MFGFGKKKQNVLLTDKQIREITKNMSVKDAKRFIKEQKRVRADAEYYAMMLCEVFHDE